MITWDAYHNKNVYIKCVSPSRDAHATSIWLVPSDRTIQILLHIQWEWWFHFNSHLSSNWAPRMTSAAARECHSTWANMRSGSISNSESVSTYMTCGLEMDTLDRSNASPLPVQDIIIMQWYIAFSILSNGIFLYSTLHLTLLLK